MCPHIIEPVDFADHLLAPLDQGFQGGLGGGEDGDAHLLPHNAGLKQPAQANRQAEVLMWLEHLLHLVNQSLHWHCLARLWVTKREASLGVSKEMGVCCVSTCWGTSGREGSSISGIKMRSK